MQVHSTKSKCVRLVALPVLAAAVGLAAAQRPQWQDQRHDDHQQSGQYGNRSDGQYGNRQGGDRPDQGRQGNDFHFRDQDRSQFQQRYQNDARRWHDHPQGRPHFARGQRIPDNYRFQPVPSSYYRGAPPPPGYQYGYYGGYVVAYNPTTRIVADVLDLATAFTR